MSRWLFELDAEGTYVAGLDGPEQGVLLAVVDEVVELLGGDPRRAVGDHPLEAVRLGVGPVPAPADPAVRRLLPDASRDDAEIAAEFRRLTEGDLRSTKVGNLLRLRAALLAAGALEMAVASSEAPAVAAALTDVRLVIAERLGVRTEEDADAAQRLVLDGRPEVGGVGATGADAARRSLATVFVVLGMLQDSLVELMLGALPEADVDLDLDPLDEDRPAPGDDTGPDGPSR